MKTKTTLTAKRVEASLRSRFNPIRNLTPESLTRMLDAFHAGDLRQAALAWDAIERRDDTLQGLAAKRKKSVARLNWEIVQLDDSPEAAQHAEALRYFYDNLTATHAVDRNQQGGLALLLKQMMDAVGKKYAVHEIVWQPGMSAGVANLSATFHFVPLWFFENRSGSIRFLDTEHAAEGTQLQPGQWLTTHGDGLMEASSIAWLFKHLPLRDWLIYCERNGMPGVKGTTDAAPDTPAWEAARQAVESFGAEFHALMTRGTQIEAIDLSARGELPYAPLVERMDRALAALWRGADLSTMSSAHGSGASLQAGETALLEHDDAACLSETLNMQVDRHVLRHLFGVEHGRAYFKLLPRDTLQQHHELELLKTLKSLGVEPNPERIAEHFNLPR